MENSINEFIKNKIDMLIYYVERNKKDLETNLIGGELEKMILYLILNKDNIGNIILQDVSDYK